MAEVELNSFITKFKYLCHAGFDASLNLSCAHGKATVTLQAEIGFMGPPFLKYLIHHSNVEVPHIVVGLLEDKQCVKVKTMLKKHHQH